MTDGSTNSRIEVLLAKQEIYELACKYSRGLDRLDADLLRSVFFDDAYCEYGFINGGPDEFVDYAMTALKAHVANHHMIGNVLYEVEGDEAVGEVYFNAYHKIEAAAPTEGDASGDAADGFEDLVIAGRYIDRYQKRDGIWKIVYRTERNDWSRSEPTRDEYFDSAPDAFRGGRLDDAVYDRAGLRKRRP
jgi:hypothetical protein